MLYGIEKPIGGAAGRMRTLIVADDAPAATEYALILGAFVAVAVMSVSLFSASLLDVWTGISTRFSDGPSGLPHGASQTAPGLTTGAQSPRGLSIQP